MGGSSRWLRAACPREVVTDGFGLFMVLWPAVPGRHTLPAAPGWGARPLAQDQQPGLVTMSSDPVAQGCTSQGPWAQGLASEGGAAPPPPCPSPTPLPSAGTGRALGTHISAQEEKPQPPPPASTTGPVTWPPSPGSSGRLVNPGPMPRPGGSGSQATGLSSQVPGMTPLPSLLSDQSVPWTPSAQDGLFSLLLSLSLLRHALWDTQKGPGSLDSGPGLALAV